jgi:hypothetical protein
MTRTKLLKHLTLPAAFVLLVGACTHEKLNKPEANLRGAQTELLADTTKVTVDVSQLVMTTSLKLGVTYMQHNLDSWNDASSVARGKGLLTGSVVYHNQHIFGFGAGSPNPRPGTYNWSSLDERVAMMTSMSATPVITFATSPSWMVDANWQPGIYATDPNADSDDNGDTDWNKVEWAPLPAHEADFASLCAKVAARYTNVKYFQVWNELKNMWDNAGNHWDYVRYTSLYNKVYDSVKKVRPDALIGGPYAPMDSWVSPPSGASSSISDASYGIIDQRCLDVVTYWLANKKGADFICIDAWVDANDQNATNPIAATKKFKDLSTWIHSKTTLPVWWSEDYVGEKTNTGADTVLQPAALGSMLIQHALAGDAVSLRWSPESQDGKVNESNFFTSTINSGGGYPFNNYYVYRDFNSYFPSGTKLYKTTVSSTNVTAIASTSKVMLVNTTSSARLVKITKGTSSSTITLQPYQVVYRTL